MLVYLLFWKNREQGPKRVVLMTEGEGMSVPGDIDKGASESGSSVGPWRKALGRSKVPRVMDFGEREAVRGREW